MCVTDQKKQIQCGNRLNANTSFISHELYPRPNWDFGQLTISGGQ